MVVETKLIGNPSEIEDFLGVSIPKNLLNHGNKVEKTDFLSIDQPRTLLPEKGPFLFFAEKPIAVVYFSETIAILARMDVLPEFCIGHFNGDDDFESRPNLPLYFIGGAAGQLCSIYTALAKNDRRFMPEAPSGSAESRGEDLIDEGSKLLFFVSLVKHTKRGYDFSYKVFQDGNEVAAGEVSTISVPKQVVFKKKKG